MGCGCSRTAKVNERAVKEVDIFDNEDDDSRPQRNIRNNILGIGGEEDDEAEVIQERRTTFKSFKRRGGNLPESHDVSTLVEESCDITQSVVVTNSPMVNTKKLPPIQSIQDQGAKGMDFDFISINTVDNVTETSEKKLSPVIKKQLKPEPKLQLTKQPLPPIRKRFNFESVPINFDFDFIEEESGPLTKRNEKENSCPVIDELLEELENSQN